MILRHGEITSGKTHECDTCGRLIFKGERAWCRVVLIRDGSYRVIIADYSCCKPLKK